MHIAGVSFLKVISEQYAKGREREENGKPCVTSVTIILFEITVSPNFTFLKNYLFVKDQKTLRGNFFTGLKLRHKICTTNKKSCIFLANPNQRQESRVTILVNMSFHVTIIKCSYS